MDSIINVLNTNKYIYAMMMILMNIGSRYIEIDLNIYVFIKHRKYVYSQERQGNYEDYQVVPG